MTTVVIDDLLLEAQHVKKIAEENENTSEYYRILLGMLLDEKHLHSKYHFNTERRKLERAVNKYRKMARGGNAAYNRLMRQHDRKVWHG